ncbi:hypothetical protein ACFVZR_29920 [Streptomyces sp. NPDC058316]|uniref:hypothetical protein n=1 Tax=unclassified Streptomyces TaxID=2593676 RepID=UPI003419FE1F
MAISASTSARSETRFRGGLKVAAICCGLLSGAAVATTATPPAAQAQHEERGRGMLVSAAKLYTLATPATATTTAAIRMMSPRMRIMACSGKCGVYPD